MDGMNMPTMPEEKPKKSGKADNSLAFGILSICSWWFLCCLYVGPAIGIVFGIIGLLLAYLSSKENGKLLGRAKAGRICSIVGIVLSILWIIALIKLDEIIYSIAITG